MNRVPEPAVPGLGAEGGGIPVPGKVLDPLLGDMAGRVLDWLATCQVLEPGYDHGGIRDILDGRVVGDHYGATHFAWACALKFVTTQDQSFLQAARLAIGFHLRTSPEEYPPGSWDYHWDFNNLAFAETCRLLCPVLEPAERQSWFEGLTHWKTNPHWAVNWVGMRAASHFARHDLLALPDDLPVAARWLEYVLNAQLGDGGIEDVVGKSLPSQYHAYSACLLHTMSRRHPAVDRAVVRAARWLLALTSPDGEMNALGRGQGQIFGYACAAYLFRAASTLDPEHAANHLWAAQAVARRLAEGQARDGYWPLVLNLPLESRGAGWYDYHHLSVYNAFAAVWLALAARLPVAAVAAAEPPAGETWLRDSGLLAVRRRYFALFCAGQEGAGYLTEAGITPHALSWGDVNLFRYPLGPGPGKYGSGAQGLGQQVHCWAPLWRKAGGEWQAPAGAAGSLEPGEKPGRWRLRFESGGAVWRRELVLGDRFLEARDVLEVPVEAGLAQDVEIRTQNVALDAGSRAQSGRTFVSDTRCGAVLRLWGGEGPADVQGVESASGRAAVLALNGASGQPSGWRLRQKPAEKGGRLPGIVCLSWDAWSTLWKRKQRLLFDLARLGRSPRTVYVEPATTLTQILESPGRLFGPEGERSRRCLTGRVKDMGHDFHLASPLLPWPGQRTFPRLAGMNRQAWLAQLRRFTDQAAFPNGYVLWVYHPSHLDALDALGDRAELVVYDWTDDWAAALPPDRSPEERRRLELQQAELLRRADVVFTVSRALFDRATRWCPFVHMLPNATDLDVFKPHDPSAESHPLAGKRPMLVYLSQITERLDTSLVAFLAMARPQWSIVLAGPVVCSPSVLDPLRGLENVTLAGPLPYGEAAAFTAQADVCLLPHKADELTRTLDPIKLYDYLATGRPIVSTDVAMNSDLSAFVRVASTPEAFLAAVEAALAEDPGESLKRRQAAVSHSWPSRATQAADVLARFFPED